MAIRSYKDAIAHLNDLQSSRAMKQVWRVPGGRSTQLFMHDSEEYLLRIGYSPRDLDKLNVLHVAGTKGKGSTCAILDSLLRHAMPQWTIGLYTSPHLVMVRERIRINGVPISEEDFAKYFFEVWDRLEKNDVRIYEYTRPKPVYFRMLTLVAFHAFLSLKVDATILEVGVGGRNDSTNIVPKPVVTGVTLLGFDHVGVLGCTLKEIAWHKGGIYKEGVPAFTVEQPEEGLLALEEAAKERNASSFTIVPVLPFLSKTNIKMGLAGEHQHQNASLAIRLAHAFLCEKVSLTTAPGSFPGVEEGLKAVRWPGRCQTIIDPCANRTLWFLDGAHTADSLECCVRWFFSPDAGLRKTSTERIRALIFNCAHGRNGPSFLSAILSKANIQLQIHAEDTVDAEHFFDLVIFCPSVMYADDAFNGDLADRREAEKGKDGLLQVQHELACAWSSLVPDFPSDRVSILPSIEDAVSKIRNYNTSNHCESNSMDNICMDILVTGCLHLVGGTVEVAGLSGVAL